MTLKVSDMHCPSCVATIESIIKNVDGVVSVAVSLPTKSVHVEMSSFDTKKSTEIEKRLKNNGFTVSEQTSTPLAEDKTYSLLKRALFSSILTAPLLLAHLDPLSQLLLSTPVFVYAGYPFISSAFNLAKHRRVGMDTLVSIGISSSFAQNLFFLSSMSPETNFASTSMVIALMTTGQYLEARTTANAESALLKTMKLRTPLTLTKVSDNKAETVPVDQVVKGDLVRVRFGESVPVDGVVVAGECWVDESMLSGESIPVPKSKDSHVTAGTVILEPSLISEKTLEGSSFITVKVLESADSTTISGIVRKLHQLSSSKTTIQRTADKASAIFVPFVLGLSFTSFMAWGSMGSFAQGIDSSIAILVGACPCALGLATPSAIHVGIGAASSRGIVFQSPSALETASKVSIMCFDKTGTLTGSIPKVSSIDFFHRNERMQRDQKRYLKSISSYSKHPLDRSLLQYLEELDDSENVEGVEIVSGKGVKGIVDGKRIAIGSLAFMKDQGVSDVVLDDIDEKEEGTLSYVSIGAQMCALVRFEENVKDSAADLVRYLKTKAEVYIVSGDRKSAVESVGKALGISESNLRYEMSPFDKEKFITGLRQKGHIIGFVGDGLNDLLVLKAADVGIGMNVEKGSAVAVEASDIAIVGDNLTKVKTAMNISKETVKVIKQNLVAAFGYNAVALPLAAFAVMGPPEASFFHGMSSIVVVANSLRLIRKFP